MRYGSAPSLIGLGNDGSWFSDPSEQMLRYRISGDRFIVNGVIQKAELVSDVGGSQTKIVIKRKQP